jgi:hypothetical protein
MTVRPRSIEELYAAAEADLQADPRVSTILRWAFWHAEACGEYDLRRDRLLGAQVAARADEPGVRAALEDLCRDAGAYRQACANVLEMLRARRWVAVRHTDGGGR